MGPANPRQAWGHAYNAAMKPVLATFLASFLTYLLRPLALGALLAFPVMTLSLAQTPPAPQLGAREAIAPTTATPPDKAIQRIHTEDAGTRIDEVRVGGETQSISVQPKAGSNLPAYEVKSSDHNKGSAHLSSSSDTNGARVWNVFKF